MLNSEAVTCEVGVLTPTFNSPGLALASSMTSFTELTGTLMLASSTEGTSATSAIGSKSLNGS